MKKPWKIRWILAAVLAAAAGSGWWLYHLAGIPFGFLFHTALLLFAGSVAGLLALPAFGGWRLRRRWLALAGAVPLLLAVILLTAAVLFAVDVRRLYFLGFPPEPDAAGWTADFRFLAGEIARQPAGLTKRAPAAELERLVKEAEASIPRSSPAQIVMQLFRLHALTGDAHSIPFVFLPCFDLHGFPVKLYRFTGGCYIVDAGRGYRHLTGAKVLKIGSLDIEELGRRFPAYIASESEAGRLDRFSWLLCAEWLYSQGAADGAGSAMFLLEQADGRRFSEALPAVELPKILAWNLITSGNLTPPVFTNPREDWYRFELRPPGPSLYIQFNKVENQRGRESLAEFARRLADFAGANEFERTVIDLRLNEGGNDILYRELLAVLRDHRKINRPGRLLVLTGRHTFSSGVLLAHQLRLQTAARFIGEATSQGPLFDANPRWVTLPNSRLIFTLSTTSTARTQPPWPFPVDNAVVPDLAVAYSHADYLAGRDPALDAAIRFQPPASPSPELTEASRKVYAGRYQLSPLRVMDVSRRGSALVFTIEDYVPASLFRVQSGLYPGAADGLFLTDIPGVQLQFSPPAGGYAPSVTLCWRGEERILPRAPEGSATPLELLAAGRLPEAIQALRAVKETPEVIFSGLEDLLNTKGYECLGKNRTADALALFQLAVELFPVSWNARDSLGEALLKAGRKTEAAAEYRRSVELNPANENGKKILEEIGH